MKDSTVEVSDGRTLAYTDMGDAGGAPLFFFHGAPTTRFRLLDFEDQFAAHGIRVISPDRPGYGGSSPQPGRSMTDWPGDVVAIADSLGVERFIVVGHSSGGPYAVACAAVLGERVTAGLTVGGVTDMGWFGAWEGVPAQEAELMRQPTEEAATAWCVERYGEDGMGFFEASPFPLPEPDAAYFADESPDSARVRAAVEAWRQGVVGYAHDIHVQAQPWSFDPDNISVPMLILHGDGDTLLSLAHSQHTTEVIPGAELRILPGHGHFTILGELPMLAQELVSGRSPATPTFDR